jgi:UDP-N-acetylglucosamine 1-carboxyvinyltransferase
MDALVIQGPAKLRGTVQVSGSKNTALPFLFASLLFDEEIRFENVPRLWDIETTLSILELIGCETKWNKEEGTVAILPRINDPLAPYEWVRRMRAGILALGPLVAKCGRARVSLPGGCAIGARPVNYHIEALRQMGASVEVEEGYIVARAKDGLKGTRLRFPEVTVTGTENALVVAVLAQGETILENAAKEPELTALADFLCSAGAQIEGIGTDTLRVKGVAKLKRPAGPVRIPADRIEAGTWISAAIATRSALRLEGCEAGRMDSVLKAYRNLGAKLKVSPKGDIIEVEPADTYSPIEVETDPYPGFPTDMQAQIMVNMMLAAGKSRVRETIFENRFMHVAELRRLGAKIQVDGNEAIIEGPARLKAAPLMATDLRASASLVVAALAAEGSTRVSRIYHLDRGYERLDQKLNALGARVDRVAE